jgi:hypothetical protein
MLLSDQLHDLAALLLGKQSQVHIEYTACQVPAGLDVLEEKRIHFPSQDSKYNSLVVEPVAFATIPTELSQPLPRNSGNFKEEG